ncbi:mutator type transposase [Tanacetum coccineum]|uniref:Mutator type transposase n=1 Tax=Tanacetum coccineum TaxID=301880 RepID=A0ABQ5ABB4_9ASTR
MGGQTSPRNYQYLGPPQKELYPKTWERYNDLLYKCPTHDINNHQKVNIFYKGLSTMNHQLLDSQGPIPGMRLAQALTAIQTMADHSQKWYDGTTIRNIGSSSSKDGLAALVNKLENLGRDMKKLKERPPGYYTKIDNHPPYGKKRQSLKELLAKHQEESARRSIEMEIEQLTKELHSRKEKSEQAKVVNVEHEESSSTKNLKNLHGISFLFDSQEENTNDQLPTKESNPGHFTFPCTIGNFNFYAMTDLGASVNVLPRNIFEYLELTNLSETEMLVEMADMRKKAPLGIVEDSVWSKRYSEWCNEISHDKKPRPRDYTFKEWVKLNKGHLDISKSVRKYLFRSWVIDQFTEAFDPNKNPLERSLDEYNWVFHKEIKQLVDEYEIKIREKGQVLEEIWTKCKRVRCKNIDWWYDYCFICVSNENNETLSLGRKNGSRFRKMIIEEMEEVIEDDGEDSDDET